MKKHGTTLFDFEDDLDPKDPEDNNTETQEEAADSDEDLSPPLPSRATLAMSAPAHSSSLFKTVTTQNAKKSLSLTGNGTHTIPMSNSLAIESRKDPSKEKKTKAEPLGLAASVFGFAFSPPTSAAESRSKGKAVLKTQLSKSADNTTSISLNK